MYPLAYRRRFSETVRNKLGDLVSIVSLQIVRRSLAFAPVCPTAIGNGELSRLQRAATTV